VANNTMPNLYILAGCNGAGKTTAAYNLLPNVFETVEFVNADEIARGLSPLNAESVAFAAARIMLERVEHLLQENKSFAFETTLSGHTYLKYIEQAKTKGYTITLFFVYLNSIELAKQRVALRVSKGGHNIPTETIERRYKKGLVNFKQYAVLVDDWYVYDNSGEILDWYNLIAKNINGELEISNFDNYKIFE
jgi:predicted ABC-type ATPase